MPQFPIGTRSCVTYARYTTEVAHVSSFDVLGIDSTYWHCICGSVVGVQMLGDDDSIPTEWDGDRCNIIIRKILF
jgi:hypothetical protein